MLYCEVQSSDSPEVDDLVPVVVVEDPTDEELVELLDGSRRTQPSATKVGVRRLMMRRPLMLPGNRNITPTNSRRCDSNSTKNEYPR